MPVALSTVTTIYICRHWQMASGACSCPRLRTSELLESKNTWQSYFHSSLRQRLCFWLLYFAVTSIFFLSNSVLHILEDKQSITYYSTKDEFLNFFILIFVDNTVDFWTTWGLGMLTLSTGENLHITLTPPELNY